MTSPTENPGKLVVAVADDETERLSALYEQASANDVEAISLIDAAAALKLEPDLATHITGALLSETSGIFDSHGYMRALTGDIEDAGGSLAYGSPVLGGEIVSGGVRLETGEAALTARLVVNAAGHGAASLANAIAGPHTASVPQMHWLKGSYFGISGRLPFARLIYPVHSSASLGLHLSQDLSGRGKAGPDAQWLDDTDTGAFDYAVNPDREALFRSQISRYWPGVEARELSPDYAGIRPKLVGEGEPPADFRIEGPGTHGSAGLINLFGIESPGLTSSLAIADHVMQIVVAET